MQGGMSHIDTFDLKTGHENQGSTTPINTNADGIRVSSHLPAWPSRRTSYVYRELTDFQPLEITKREITSCTRATNKGQRFDIPDLARGITSSKANLTPTLPASVFVGRESRFHGSGGFFEPEFEPLAIKNRNPDSNTQGPW